MNNAVQASALQHGMIFSSGCDDTGIWNQEVVQYNGVNYI